jgi:DNA-binding NtrC family response regulator
MVTGSRDPKTIVKAVTAGAIDYICKPFATDELLAIIEKDQSAKKIRDRHNALIEDLNPPDTKSRILGSSPSFRKMMSNAARLKGHKANVLILGESGTGKELLARYVHSLEENTRRPFIAVNCAAIPDGLIESELFGYERGAFTGAHHRKIGKFELANEGDIFLDEISSLKPSLQAKILRVLQEKEIVRVGGNRPVSVNFRVIAATNENLLEKVGSSEFRVDLYHRLRVVELHIPALRERLEDIPLLIAYFLDKFSIVSRVKKISSGALRRLQEYSWPGNVRELENVIHSLTILSSEEIISVEHLPHWMNESLAHALISTTSLSAEDSLKIPNDLSSMTLRDFVKAAEKLYIERALDQNRGDKTKTALSLKMGRTTLYGKLKELDLMN